MATDSGLSPIDHLANVTNNLLKSITNAGNGLGFVTLPYQVTAGRGERRREEGDGGKRETEGVKAKRYGFR